MGKGAKTKAAAKAMPASKIEQQNKIEARQRNAAAAGSKTRDTDAAAVAENPFPPRTKKEPPRSSNADPPDLSDYGSINAGPSDVKHEQLSSPRGAGPKKKKGKKVKVTVKCDSFFNFFRTIDPSKGDKK